MSSLVAAASFAGFMGTSLAGAAATGGLVGWIDSICLKDQGIYKNVTLKVVRFAAPIFMLIAANATLNGARYAFSHFTHRRLSLPFGYSITWLHAGTACTAQLATVYNSGPYPEEIKLLEVILTISGLEALTTLIMVAD